MLTDKNYTDEEIISSLEVIATTRNCSECKIRNCKWGTCNCEQTTANAALELINRQKLEIEKLNIQLQGLWNTASLYKAESEMWEGYNENLLTANNTILSNEILSAKTEAYKEFAERLKDAFPECNRHCICPAIGFDDYCYIIDECCEELCGEEE